MRWHRPPACHFRRDTLLVLKGQPEISQPRSGWMVPDCPFVLKGRWKPIDIPSSLQDDLFYRVDQTLCVWLISDMASLQRNSPETKLQLFVSNLSKTVKFYSAIGIEWGKSVDLGITPEMIKKLEAECSILSGMPQLWGKLGNIEVIFFYRSDPITSGNDMQILWYLNRTGAVAEIVKKLKEEGLFSVEGDFEKTRGGVLLDPDGRRIEVSDPPPGFAGRW
jgi:hypothetical protein